MRSAIPRGSADSRHFGELAHQSPDSACRSVSASMDWIFTVLEEIVLQRPLAPPR